MKNTSKPFEKKMKYQTGQRQDFRLNLLALYLKFNRTYCFSGSSDMNKWKN